MIKIYPVTRKVIFSGDTIKLEHLVPDLYHKTYSFIYNQERGNWYLANTQYWIGELPVWLVRNGNLREKLLTERVYLEEKEPEKHISIDEFDLIESKRIADAEEGPYLMNTYDVFEIGKKKGGTGYTHRYCDLIEGYNCSDLSSCIDGNKGLKRCSTEPNYEFPRTTDGKPDYNTWVEAGNSVKTSYINSSSLFDYVYSCRMDNGAKSTKDGSKYLGKGFIHLTGKSSYKRVSKAWNKKCPNDKKEFHRDDIDELENNVEVAMKASLVLWELDDINDLADEGLDQEDIDNVGRKVNGARKDKLPNGYRKRRKFTNKANEVFDDE